MYLIRYTNVSGVVFVADTWPGSGTIPGLPTPFKIERTECKMYGTRDQAKAEVFDDIELLLQPTPR